MGSDSNYHLYDAHFHDKMESFFHESVHHDLLPAMYAFGVTYTSFHQRPRGLPMEITFNPFRGKWDMDMLGKIELGKDDQGAWDEENKDSDVIQYYRLKRAVSLHRPTWTLFWLLGCNQGELNGQRMTKELYESCLLLVPQEFVNNYKELLNHLFDYFDECGYSLTVKGNELSLDPMRRPYAFFDVERSVYEKIALVSRYQKLMRSFQGEPMTSFSPNIILEQLRKTGYDFKQNGLGAFFGHWKVEAGYDVRINLHLEHGIVQVILWAKNLNTSFRLGGDVHEIVRKLQDTELRRPQFSNYDDLNEIVEEFLPLYEDFRKAVRLS